MNITVLLYDPRTGTRKGGYETTFEKWTAKEALIRASLKPKTTDEAKVEAFCTGCCTVVDDFWNHKCLNREAKP